MPFLKWAGGKRWLTHRIGSIVPSNYETYFEPFLGSAALFFALRPASAILGDLNSDLISTYVEVRENPIEVWDYLTLYQLQHSDEHYYAIRDSLLSDPAELAARFIYLNRTCWNGLYRVNRQGHFNVPRGSKSVALYDYEDPLQFCANLKSAQLICSDFEMIVDCAGRNDLIFADPPYTVKHNYNGFLKYNESLFSWEDQERLAKALLRALRRGAFVVVSNADHKSIRDLYRRNFKLIPVKRASVLAASPEFRSPTSELLILGRPK